jgi:hypothetical protein
MALQIVSQVHFDEAELAKTLACIKTLPFSDAYSRYALGLWRTCLLANRTGDLADALSEEYEGTAIPTESGRKLDYLMKLVRMTFQWKYLKSARIFESGGTGLIIPHRDYLEFKDGFTRLHLPLQTDPRCYNSEDDRLYHMRKGEIWFLDARRVHSAGSFGRVHKLSLVLDFDPNVPVRELFRSPASYRPMAPPPLTHRPPLDEGTETAIRGLCALIDEACFQDVVTVLAKIHFSREVHAGRMYEWLEAICRDSGKGDLVQRARAMRESFVGVAV